jgi:hypothetical protein
MYICTWDFSRHCFLYRFAHGVLLALLPHSALSAQMGVDPAPRLKFKGIHWPVNWGDSLNHIIWGKWLNLCYKAGLELWRPEFQCQLGPIAVDWGQLLQPSASPML